MSDLWRKTLVYLGLVEEPEEHEETPAAQRPEPRASTERGRPEAGERRVRTLRSAEGPSPAAPRDTHVRAVSDGPARVVIIRPVDFEEAERIGERYRAGQPVLLDLGQADTGLARRLLDFVAGTIFALRGRIRPVGSRVFLLVPDGVEVGPEERRRLADLGYRMMANEEQA